MCIIFNARPVSAVPTISLVFVLVLICSVTSSVYFLCMRLYYKEYLSFSISGNVCEDAVEQCIY